MMVRGVGQYDPNYEMLESYHAGSNAYAPDPTEEMLYAYYGASGGGAGTGSGTETGGAAKAGTPVQVPYDVGAVYKVTGTARAPGDIPWWILVLLGVAGVMIIANN